MSVWYAIPSKRPPEEAGPVLQKWRERGYKIALLVDWNPPGCPLETRSVKGDIMLCGGGRFAPKFDPETKEPLGDARTYFPNFNEYPGYAASVNALVAEIIKKDSDCEWIVTGGDDIEPDPNHSAEEIARECSEYFLKMAWLMCWHWDGKHNGPAEALAAGAYAEQKPQALWSAARAEQARTFGVMQPTGDRWQVNGPGTQPGIDLVAGSPWMGREFCRRMYGGRGPLCEEYYHCGEDEELQHVATMLGVFWQRPDLIQMHHHWGRPREGEKLAPATRMPAFLARANSREEWQNFKKTFAARKAAGFPGHEPMP